MGATAFGVSEARLRSLWARSRTTPARSVRLNRRGEERRLTTRPDSDAFLRSPIPCIGSVES